ncbi:MAG: response regulator [Chloroflexota bacterium]
MTVRVALIVDDDVVLCELFSYAFRNANYETFVAHDVTQAFNLLHDNAIDVLLLDHSMPGTTGREMLQTIRDTSELQHLKVIMVTAEEGVMIDPCIQANTDLILLKPVSFSQLVQLASRLLSTLSDDAL